MYRAIDMMRLRSMSRKMDGRAASTVTLILLLMGAWSLAFGIGSVQAGDTVYIKSDGTVSPATAPISRDGSVYTFTANIRDKIVVQKGDIIINGAGFTLQGPGYGTGFSLTGVRNVTIKGTNINGFYSGVGLSGSSYNAIFGNNVTNGWFGVELGPNSNYNIVSYNNITDIMYDGIGAYLGHDNIISHNTIMRTMEGIIIDETFGYTLSENNLAYNQWGICVRYSSNNDVLANNITGGSLGIHFIESHANTVSENNIADNEVGIRAYASGSNIFFRNNFVNNAIQVETAAFYSIETNVWDDGYPSAGNYWSDYADVDSFRGPYQNITGSDGIWDHAYSVNYYETDHYPLVKPWSSAPRVLTASVDVKPDSLNFRSRGLWTTAYIQLPQEYNVADINASTILLNGTMSPILDPKYGFATNSSEYLVDHDGDGILERMIKFDMSEVKSFIYGQGGRYGYFALTIGGKLFDGTLFEGTDVVFVNFCGDVNNDGMIDVLDAALTSAHWYPGPPGGPLGFDSIADLNNDGVVNIQDASLISANWGETLP